MGDESQATATGTVAARRRRRSRSEALSQRFARRDPRAIDEVYGRHAPGLFVTAYRVLGDRDLASEAVQRAMLKAWQHAHTFDHRRPLEPWLHAICRHAAIDTHRTHRRDPLPTHSDELSRRMPVAADDITDRSTFQQVRDAIAELPTSERDVMRLAYLDGLTHVEVAEALGIPVGTVKSRTHRAHRRLSVQLAHLRDAV